MEPSSPKSQLNPRGVFERFKALWSSTPLPPVPAEEVIRRGEPRMLTLQNAQGAKTHVSIERLAAAPGMRNVDSFCAVQNTPDGTRHTLEYEFTETDTGQLSIEGKLFELGAMSRLPNTTVSFTKTLLMDFYLSSDGKEPQEAARIRQAVFGLSEAFTEDGCYGVDDYVRQSISSSKSHVDWKLYGERMRREQDAAVGDEPHDERFGEIPDSRRSFTPEQVEYLDRIYDALLAIDDLSVEQYQSLYSQGVVIDPRADFKEELRGASSEHESSTNLWHGALSRSLPFSRVWLNLFSPHIEQSNSVLVAIQLPFSRAPKSASLKNLVIEVRGPRNKMFFREKYRVKDSENVLAIDRYTNNDEFFRNLFRELHAVNHSAFEDERKTAHILELLEIYGLTVKPHGFLTRLSRAWSMASAYFTGIPA